MNLAQAQLYEPGAFRFDAAAFPNIQIVADGRIKPSTTGENVEKRRARQAKYEASHAVERLKRARKKRRSW